MGCDASRADGTFSWLRDRAGDVFAGGGGPTRGAYRSAHGRRGLIAGDRRTYRRQETDDTRAGVSRSTNRVSGSCAAAGARLLRSDGDGAVEIGDGGELCFSASSGEPVCVATEKFRVTKRLNLQRYR